MRTCHAVRRNTQRDVILHTLASVVSAADRDLESIEQAVAVYKEETTRSLGVASC